jgi:O-antigen ligase
MFFVYATIAKACASDERVPLSLLKGLTAGLIMEAAVVLWERYAMGVILADGTFAGHNFLGLLSHFIVFPNLALILAGERGAFVSAALFAGLIVEVFTTSRATIGLAGFGYVILFALSAIRQWTSRKMVFFFIGLVALSAAAPVAISSFEKRFATEDMHEFDERAAFERAAAMILAAHPLGIGANHYVVVAGNDGYNKAAGVPQASGQNDAVVHNLYWLVAAETGYPGVITFIILLLYPLVVALRCGWRNRRDRRGDLLVGIGVSLLVVYLHCFYEWILINYQGQYVLVMEFGLVAGLAQQLGYWQRSQAQSRVLSQGLSSPGKLSAN